MSDISYLSFASKMIKTNIMVNDPDKNMFWIFKTFFTEPWLENLEVWVYENLVNIQGLNIFFFAEYSSTPPIFPLKLTGKNKM